MNKFMNKFNDIYLSIICEDWDRFEYLDIIRATNLVTNNCTDAWSKGDTGKKVFAFLKENGFRSRGGKAVNFSAFYDNDNADQVSNSEIEKIKGENRFYNGSANYDDSYITSYWRARSKSNSSFDAKTFATIWKYSYQNNYRKFEVLAPDVGTIVYGIWKALNSKTNKIEQNLKDVEENGFEYTEGQKIENLELVVKDVKTSVGNSSFGYSYSESTELVCEDQKSGWKYKVRLGKNTSTKLADLISYAKRNEVIDILDSEFSDIRKINVSGKVLRISKEWKSVTLNYVTINSPSDSEIDSIEKKLNEKKEEKEVAMAASKKLQETLGTLKFILKTVESNPDSFNTENKELNDFLRNTINNISDEDYENLSSEDKRAIGKIEKLFNL